MVGKAASRLNSVSSRKCRYKKNLSYLADVHVPRIDTKNVMLLIGTAFPGAHIPLEMGSCNCNQPYPIRTRLGWVIREPPRTPCTTKEISVNFQTNKCRLVAAAA